MNIADIGRNDPCPCGSGAKFKKCCMGNPEKLQKVLSGSKQKLMPPIYEIDYGAPRVDDQFLDSQDIHRFSPQQLLYSELLMPQVEEFATALVSKDINRSRGERARIENSKSATELIEIMSSNPDPVNHLILKRQILEIQEQTIPMILQELQREKNTHFYELTAQILQAADKKYLDPIIDIIENHQRNPYAVSLLAIVLGFYNERPKSVKLLWNLYHYFKANYPEKTYSDGPLIALLEQRAQDRERFELVLQNRRT